MPNLPTTDGEWVQRLRQLHDKQLPTLRALNAYYEGTQPLSYMHPEVMAEVGDRIKPVILFWPQLVIDALEERLDVEGFRHVNGDADNELWRVWQANNLDEESQQSHIDALVMRRSYVIVGTNEADRDTPLVTVESPLETYAEIDPRTRKVRAALKRVKETDQFGTATTQEHVSLYLPDRTVWYENWSAQSEATHVDEHGLGEVPVVPLVNRPRTADRYGRSELNSVIPLSDAANKLATDMMVGAEFHAIPLRGMFGAGPEDFVDIKGQRQTAIQTIMGRLLAIKEAGGQTFEFSASSLANFHQSIDTLARMVSAMAGLPPHFMGYSSDNPASADAIRSSETRLIKRAERKQGCFGGSWEHVNRLVGRFQTGDWDPALKRLETVWRNAATPTIAQAADAAVKLYGETIVTLRQTREDLRYTQTQIERMEADDAPKGLDLQAIEAAGALIRAGFKPVAVNKALGLPDIDHTGALPVTVQAVEDPAQPPPGPPHGDPPQPDPHGNGTPIPA